GIVSGLARSGGEMGRGGGYFIQTDAAINPGNSGGALVDIQGNLLGINTSIVSRSGGSTGIGFAIPSNLVERYVQAAESGLDRVPVPWSGADVQTVDADMAHALDMVLPRGVMIQRLHAQSPLRAAGLSEGDIILSVAGQTVDSPGELDYRLAVLGVGQTASVSYVHGGIQASADVTLAEPPSGGQEAVTVKGRTLLAGLQIADVDPALIDTLNLPLDAKGVVVTGVDGPSSRTGLRAGDILTVLNGTEIASAQEFAKIAEAGAPYWEIEVIRGNQRGTIRFGG
ncbi:MAG: PDZ domain-containing protein, partial [Paracoccaceae bacterium]